MRNVEDAFWQSRMTTAGKRAELPNLVSLPTLARNIRHDYATAILVGLPHTAITPTAPLDGPSGGSQHPRVARSLVADLGAARRWLGRLQGGGQTQPRGGDAATQTPTATFAGIPIVANPSLPTATFILRRK